MYLRACMSTPKERSKADRPAGRSIPARFPDHIIAEIDKAVKATGESQQTIIRLAVQAGLKDLSRIKYDVGSAIYEKARRGEKL